MYHSVLTLCVNNDNIKMEFKFARRPWLIIQKKPLSCCWPKNTDNYREKDNYSGGWGYLLEGGYCLEFNNKFLKISQSNTALADINSTVYH